MKHLIYTLLFLISVLNSTGQDSVVCKYDVAKVKTGLNTADHTVGFPISGTDAIDVVINEDGTTSIKVNPPNRTNGIPPMEFKVKTDSLPTTIKDSNGDIYQVSKDESGKAVVQKVGSSSNLGLTQQQLDEVKTDKALVTFHAYNEAKYAFDDYKEAYTANSDWRAKFQKIDGYRVPSKAIAAGKTDKVIAALTIKSDDIIADSIQFVTGTGTRFEYEKLQDGRYAISLIGGPAGDAQEIYAVVKNKQGDYITAGKLLLVSYTEQHRKVVLVPVNGTMPDKAAVEKRLNEIYNPA